MKSWVRVICELHFAIVKTHPVFAQRHTRSLCRDTPCLWAEILPVFVQRHIQSLCRYTQSLRRDTSGLCVETHPVLVQTHTVLRRDTPGLGAKTHSVLRRDIPGLYAETQPVFVQRHIRSLCRDTSGLAQRHTQSLSRVRASSFFFYLTLNRRLDKMTLLQGLSCHQLHSVWYYLHYKLLPIDKRGDKFEAGQKSERMNILIPNAEE